MTKKEDGGPAFPLTNRDYQEAYGGAPGMTLRDYFAGQALAGIGNWIPDDRIPANQVDIRRRRAAWAYAQADAMLEEREK